MEKSKEDFEQISKTIKEEVKRFDLVRANEFRVELTKYIEKLCQSQENVCCSFINSIITNQLKIIVLLKTWKKVDELIFEFI